MKFWLLSLGVSLLLTLVLEGCFALIAGKKGRSLALVLLVNVLTNPPVVFFTLCWREFTDLPDWYLIPLLEVLAVLTEGFLYARRGEDFARPYLFSLSANALSYSLGLLVTLL